MDTRTDWFFAALAAIALTTATTALANPLWGPVFESPNVHAALRTAVGWLLNVA